MLRLKRFARTASPTSPRRLESRSKALLSPPCHISNVPVGIFDTILSMAIDEPGESEFPQLPTVEIWDNRMSTLLACSQVNKAFHARAEMFLSRHIRLCDDRSVKLWLKSKATKSWRPRTLALRNVASGNVRKMIKRCEGLVNLELYFLDDLDVGLMGFQELSELESLILSSPLLDARTRTIIRIPFLVNRRRTTIVPVPTLPFSLKKLWINTGEASIPDLLLTTIISASALSLEKLEVRTQRGQPVTESSNTLGEAMMRISLPCLTSLHLDGEVITPKFLQSLKSSPLLDNFFLDGTTMELMNLLNATCSDAQDNGILVEMLAAFDSDLETLEDRVHEVKKLGVKSVKLYTKDGLHVPQKNGFQVVWTERAHPNEKLQARCLAAGLSYSVNIGED